MLRGEVGSPFPALVWALAHVRARTGATDPWLDTLVAWYPGWPSEALEYLAVDTPDATRDEPTRTMLERWRPGGLFCVFGDGKPDPRPA